MEPLAGKKLRGVGNSGFMQKTPGFHNFEQEFWKSPFPVKNIFNQDTKEQKLACQTSYLQFLSPVQNMYQEIEKQICLHDLDCIAASEAKIKCICTM